MELPIDIIIRVDAKKENDSGEYTFQCKALGELVRCGECKYFDGKNCCERNGIVVWDMKTWYCADGERKEKEECSD